MTDPTNLVAFLLARIAERETDAYRALDHAEGPLWVVTGMDSAVGVDYDPQLVLAECAALRQIVALHTGNHECVVWWEQTAEDIADGDPPRTRTTYVHPDFINADDPTLRLLALLFADQPGYDPSWAVKV